MNTKQFNAKILNTAKKLNLITKLGDCCSMCGESSPWKLEFHHDGDKTFDINSKRDGRISVLLEEIENCICVCGNCHRKIHHNTEDTIYKQVKIKMLEYKNTNCCSKCGYSELNSALEFHHTNPDTKEFAMSSYRGGTEISDTYKKELDKCVVLCVNCHREEHYDLKFYENHKDLIIEKSKNIKELQPALDKEEVRRLYESGTKPVEIAKKYNASKGTICGILKSFGLTKSMDDIKIDREEFKKFVLSGNNSKKIQAHFNINKSTMFTICKELDIKITKMEKNDPDNGKMKSLKCTLSDAEFIDACKTKTGSELAREFNVSPVAISLRKKRLGLR